jgi:hypothetical protein
MVIVVGVLVALAVDAAWELRTEWQQEQAYYAALARDLASDTAEYQVALRMAARSIESSHAVRSAILGRPPSVTRPLSQSLNYASWVNHPSWSFGTLDELYGGGSVRLIRDAGVKSRLHEYRSSVDEWRPRLGPPEVATYLAFRQYADGFLPLDARIAYVGTRLEDEQVAALDVDEEALARRVRGDEVLLDLTDRMIIEWTHLVGIYEEQRLLARQALTSVEARVEHRADPEGS